MGGHHLCFRALVVITACAFAGPNCACPDRTVGETPEGQTQPACLWLISPRGFRADGSPSVIFDRDYHRSGTVCLCLTQEEYDAMGERLDRVGFPEPGTLLEEYNELAYEECKRLSAIDTDDFVDDECLDYYKAGEWLKDIYFNRGSWDNGAPPGFTCYE